MRDPDELEAAIHRLHNRLRGRMAGFIEACGLPERQERSMISTMKSLSYDTEKSIVEEIHESPAIN